MVTINLWKRIVEKDHSQGKSNRNAREAAADCRQPVRGSIGKADNHGQNPAAPIYG
jgi:hypothetical protein